MASAERRRLIVTADDFGRSASINQAVEQAHRDGVLTCASLMVNGVCFDQAVQIAKRNPNLGVGLHLTLVCGRGKYEEGCIEETIALAWHLKRLDVPCDEDIWGADVSHDWVWWKRQAAYHFGRRFGANDR